MIDEQVIEDIRAQVRTEMIERVRKAAENAVPQATRDYLDGVTEGVRLIVEAIESDPA